MVSANTFIPRENCSGPCPTIFCHDASQFSSFPSVPGTLCTPAPALELRVSVFVSEQVHTWTTQEECLGLRSPPSQQDTSLTGFHSQLFWGRFFPALITWFGYLICSWDPLLLRADLSIWDSPPDYQLPHHKSGICPFHISVPPTILIVAFSLYS